MAEARQRHVEAIIARMYRILEARQFGHVRVFGERVLEQLDEQIGHVHVHRVQVDERIAQLEFEHRFGQQEFGVFFVPEARERTRVDNARQRRLNCRLVMFHYVKVGRNERVFAF